MGINYARASAPYGYTFPTPSAPPMPNEEAPAAQQKEDPNGVCTICLEGNSTRVDKNKPHVIVAGKCMHFFHESCLKPLMAAKKNDGTTPDYAKKCPNCRAAISLNSLVVVDLTQQAPKPQPTRNSGANQLTVDDQKALNKECAVCLDVVSDHPNSNAALPRNASLLKCGHAFHQYCIQAHVNNGLNTDCPTCRRPIAQRDIKVIDCSNMRLSTTPAAPAPQQAPAYNLRPTTQPVSQGDGLTLGGALMGMLRGTGKVLKFGGQVLGKVLDEALKPDMQAHFRGLKDRQDIIYATWKNFTDNNSKELRKLNSSLEHNLTYSASIPYADYRKANARFSAVEKVTQNFIKEIRTAQDKLAQVLAAEAKNI